MAYDFDAFALDMQVRKQQELDVLLQKQRDYGPFNIARPPSGITPEVALAVRINDKLQRLGNLLAAGYGPSNESLADTALDIANYGTILSSVLEREWPGLAVD